MTMCISVIVFLLANFFQLAGEDKKEKSEDAKFVKAREQIAALDKAITAYHLKNKEYPPNLQILADKKANGGKALLTFEALFDPWKSPYLYDPAGTMNRGKKPDVWTEAPNKELIGNWMNGTK
jgi:hypothetical protein